MQYLHAMVRIRNIDESMRFYRDLLGLQETRRHESEAGQFTLIYLATAKGEPEIELTYNWDAPETYGNARNFGHLAFSVENIYQLCETLQENGVTILRPPRDGRMAFVKSPDDISIELLQKGEALVPKEPWVSMPSTGSW